MEVRIGVVHTPKELSFEADGDGTALVSQIQDAVAAGSPLVWIDAGENRRIGVPTDKIAYVEILVEDESRKVGFGR